MKKKYFAKLVISSHGERSIKKDDWIIINERDTTPVRYNGGELTGEEKRLDLFLCSKEISKGNHFSYGVSEVGEATSINDDVICCGDIPFLRTECYRAIGKISEGAIWIKEGDEFDEKDIKHYFDNTLLEKLPYLPAGYTIYIKCGNCKTYH